MRKVIALALALFLAAPAGADETLPAMEQIRHEMRMMQRQTLGIVAFAAGTGLAVWAVSKYQDEMDKEDAAGSVGSTYTPKTSQHIAVGVFSTVVALTGLVFAINPEGGFGGSESE